MKKQLKLLAFVSFAVVSLIIAGCKKDGNGENVKKDDLTKVNEDIAALQTLINASENGVEVKSVESDKGYTITFTDGSAAVINNVGSSGGSTLVVGAGVSEGRYYWNVTAGASTFWLTDVTENKIPVTGRGAITPKLKIENEMWMISYDNGGTFAHLLDGSGNPITTSTAASGGSFFRSVKADDSQLTVVLNSGTELKIPIAETIKYKIAENVTDEIDMAVFGSDGMGYFYEVDDETSIPERLTIYNVAEDKMNAVIEFDEEGLPKTILRDEGTVVLGNYVDNKFSAVLITRDGESLLMEDIETDIQWDNYKKALQEADTKAVSKSIGKWITTISTGAVCAILVYGAVIDPEVVSKLELAEIALTCIGAVGGFIDTLFEDETPTATGAEVPSNIESISSKANELHDENKNDIAVGSGSLSSGNGEIKVTLTWDSGADLDLNCVDPSGFRIYHGARRSSASGGYMDVDNTDGSGPENIYFTSAPAGSYRIYVNYYAPPKEGRDEDDYDPYTQLANYQVIVWQNNRGTIYGGPLHYEETRDIVTFTH